ncbi:MAG: hypothetical protein ACT4OF_00120 [Caulobacteraceae bacterium]
MHIDKIRKNLLADEELREKARAFLVESASAGSKSDEEFRSALESSSFRIADGIGFVVSDALRDAERQLVIRAVRLLGGKYGNEKDVSTSVWDSATAHLRGEATASAEDVSQLISCLTVYYEVAVQCVLPNQLITLTSDVEFLDLGPVRIANSEHATKRLGAKAPRNMTFTTGSQSGFAVLPEAQHLVVEVGPFCWIVDVNAAPGNIEEEAIWLIDVAVSLLRLVHKKATDLFPRLGEVEPHPTEEASRRSMRATMKGDGLSVGGTSIVTSYTINTEVVSWLSDDDAQRWITHVFDPPKGTLAERVHAGLGWLSRGRQAKGRAERLLYFFTALEAVLSAPDKAEPVVQTVARNASVILSNDNKVRASIAKDIRRLYGRRSALVHAGRRDISKSAATSVQLFAEGVFRTVLARTDPKDEFSSFHSSLAEATYGLTWPPGTAHDR